MNKIQEGLLTEKRAREVVCNNFIIIFKKKEAFKKYFTLFPFFDNDTSY
jgi:hypothetical protein